MTRTALLCSGLAALAALGCAGQSPTAVDQAPSNGSQAVWESAPALGIYHLEGKAGGELSLSPVARASQALGDSFSVDITSIAGPNFRLSGIEFLADGSLRATFAFKHPLPDTTSRKDLHVFDLRMHVLSPTVGTTFGGAAGLSAPTGADGASEELKQAATGLTNADGWSTWGDEIVEPAIGSLAPNLYPYKLIHEDTARPIPLNADAPAGWNVVPQSNATYTVAAIFKLTAGQSVDLFLGLDASYGNSAVGQRVIPKPDPGGRLNPRYLNPEFNLKEAWKTEVESTGTVTAGVATSAANIEMRIFDHQGNLPGSGPFDPLASPTDTLRYASGLKEVVLSIPGAVANAITLPADTFTGDGKPATPYTRTYALTGDMVSGTATAGTYVGMAAFRDQMVDSAAANAPLPTKGYTRTNEIVTRYDFTTYQTFTIDVAVDANQPPVADLVANPLSVPNGGTTQLSPGPGTADPDGSITLYEYDFNYDGTFTADTSNTTGAAVTSPALTTAGTVTMALRVTDNGTPGKAAIDTADVTVQAPPNQPPTAEAVANPTTVPNGGTTQLSPGPGTADPDGSITLYEYDFNYSGTFTADASNTTGAAVTSPALTTAGSVTMALRVTDNGTPGLTALDTVDVVVEAPPANQPPTADVVANPTTVASGATTQLSPGPGTGDPDGSVILYEFDFEYTGTFTADTSNTTGAAVTSPALTNAGAAPITRQMAMRVTDNGAPGLTAIDTVTVTINPAPSGPTWTQIHNLIVNGDPAVEFSDCVACHAGGQGGLTMNANKDTTYANLVNVASSCGTDYVEPNNAAASLLYHKLTPSPGCGARMPRGGPYWTAASIQMVADWINAGAPNN